MEKTIGTEVLNERLRFCERTRAELVAEIDKKQHCTEELLKGCLTKTNRPVYYELNRLADIVSHKWVCEKKEALAAEIKDRFPAMTGRIAVLHEDSPAVVVLEDGKLVGVYHPDTGRIY